SITLGWSKPEYDGGSEITSYVVEKRVGEEGEWTVISHKGEVRTTEYVASDLKPDIDYYFRVSAVNCAGRGDPIEMEEPVQAKDILGIINNLNNYFAEEAQVDTDVAMRTHYIVKAGKDVEIMVPLKGRPAPNVSWKKEDQNIDNDPKYDIHNTDTSSCLIITQVTRNDTGKYTINISNGVGEPKSLTVSVKVQDTPAACRNLILKDVTRGKVTLCWEPPLLDGGAEITNYVIEKRDSSKRTYACVTNKCKETTCVIEELSEKASFFFRVLAENENGVGDPCETTEPVKATETPGPVKDLSMKDSTKTSVTLQWNKPDYDVCSKNEKGTSDFIEIGPIKVKDYIIPPEANLEEYPDGQISVRLGHNVHVELPYKGKPRPTILWLKDNLPLKESEKIRFKKTENKATLMIKNVEKENGGKYTLTLDNTFFRKSFHIQVITLGPPSKPIGPIRLDEVRAESISISWDEPNDNGGGEITCYTVEKCDTSQTGWKMACSSVIGTSFKVLNLIKGIQYQFRVCAENRYGGSEPLVSQNVIAKHEFRPPGPPGMPVVYNVTNDVKLKWDAPKRDGGSKIVAYNVEKRQGKGRWLKSNFSNVTDTEFTVTGLACGERYEFRVIARNAIGTVSPPSQSSGYVLIRDESCKYTQFRFFSIKAGENIRLKVTIKGRPTPKVTWYRDNIELTKKMVDITTISGSSTLFIRDADRSHRGLYTESVKVEVFAPSNISMPIKCAEPTEEPDAPSIVNVTDTTNTSVSLEWTRPAHDGGMEIHGYIIEMCKGSEAEWHRVNEDLCAVTRYSVTGLETGAEYKFRICAVNSVGKGEAKEIGITNQLITSRIGESFEIDVPISGRPAPKVSWKLEEMRLKETDRVSIKTNKNRTTLTVKDCMRGDGGRYFLTLENVTGSKTFTVTVNVIGRPSPPEGPIEISSITSESCVLSWNPPEDDGGTDITNYIIEKRESGCTAWQLINSSVKHTSFHVSHLTKYMQYTFRICAENRFGVSKPTESETIVAEHPFGM
uniref:Titin n=1 Tax=Cyprinus carpio TaxID=7962 RepID=A0A8C1WCJ3_CYPCA